MINFYAKEIVWFIFWWYLPPQRYGQFNLFFINYIRIRKLLILSFLLYLCHWIYEKEMIKWLFSKTYFFII
jgi:hypothetical protein